MKNTLNLIIAILIIWLAIIFGGTLLQTGGEDSLTHLVQNQILIAYFIAPLFLIIFIYRYRSRMNFGIRAPQSLKSWRVIWFPLLLILGFLSVALTRELPETQKILFITINTFLVGVSEELMFRGLFFSGALSKFSIWKAIWLTSIVFGLVHIMNGFITGDFLSATAQSLQAAFAGLWFLAIRIKTKSIYPAILVHWLWDFSLFLMVWNADRGAAIEQPLELTLLIPIIMQLPPFIYGLWILRGDGKLNWKEYYEVSKRY